MTSDEHKAAAERLTAAVKNNTNGAYDEWTSRGQDLKSPNAQADFVKRHAGLSETPSPEDLAAINQHVATSLQNDVADIKAKNPGEHVVGLMCQTED